MSKAATTPAWDELEIQHRFFHILTPQQQQMWLSSCLK